ncbi:MAG: hypothetical protein QOG97_1238 [Acidimicrobiaceae bacterium]|nr:hypothetical protein [Acidimicrobiaceae bacterium]
MEARRIELPNLLHAMQALYQLSYAPAGCVQPSKGWNGFGGTYRPQSDLSPPAAFPVSAPIQAAGECADPKTGREWAEVAQDRKRPKRVGTWAQWPI